ncbi:hypothetical protein L596_020665 [Steinernema carpocapsae]|uniref:EF-hand domain-containing protein n=1 Tax=Steinernema carpocapsae TaxID=34508 RepID=A0A4U5MU79_STECR|nr:hypothetical protein L596_020665 [Steinernema carpocapsae]
MGSRVTKSNKANRTSASKIYDADGDGYADEHDLDRALLAVGYHMPQSELLRHRIAHDTDGDGRVSFAEYLNMEMDPLKLAIRERFFDYDVNYNGLITRYFYLHGSSYPWFLERARTRPG